MNREATRMRRLLVAAGTVLGTVVGALAFAAPAAAHVTVEPSSAPQGGYAGVAFRVPNEEESATTTKVEIHLPTDTPIASAFTQRVIGWQATVTRTPLPKPVKIQGLEITEAVTRITWTATTPDAAIPPGQYEEFGVGIGPLPQADQIVFKAVQTFSNGETVSWDQAPSDGAEVERPAPVLKLTKATGTDSTGPNTANDSANDSADASDTSGQSSSLMTVLTVVALVASLAALLLAGLTYSRHRTAAPGAADDKE